MIKLCGILVSLTNDVKTANFEETRLQRTVLGTGEGNRDGGCLVTTKTTEDFRLRLKLPCIKTNPSHTLYSSMF
jgi:hypothetical protein